MRRRTRILSSRSPGCLPAGCGPLPVGCVIAERAVAVDLRPAPARQLDDEARAAQQRARRGDEQSEVRARGLREGGQRGVQPQTAIERDGDARGPVVERDQARVGRPVLAADQRRELGLGRVGPRRREQPLAVRQRHGRTGAVRDRLQRRAFERRAHDHDRARCVVLARAARAPPRT